MSTIQGPTSRSSTPKSRRQHQIDWKKVYRIAAERFEVAHFRPGQREILECVLSGRNVLGILPTGGGKSLCYQIPAALSDKPVVVISPLISLMQDQQDHAAEADLNPANLSSAQRRTEEREHRERIASGEADLIYVTPERLDNPEYMDLLREKGVSLFVVDEAHCISHWGHDFRPAYLNLRESRRLLGNPPLLALTATATPEVIKDVLTQLGAPDTDVVNTGISRPNLFFEVLRTVNADSKREEVRRLLNSTEGSCIVYCATVRTCNDLWDWLRENGIDAAHYHGKLRAKERELIQDDFMSGKCRIIVATKAFGLGIDKPDVRLVTHYQFPDSLESYYQEAGRAGRDDEPARATLLYRVEDRRIQSFFLGGKYPKREQSRLVFEALSRQESSDGVTTAQLSEMTALARRKVQVIVSQLIGAEIVSRSGRRIRKLRDFASTEEFDQFLGAYEKRGLDDRARLDTMIRYSQTARCRVRFMKEYFGEEVDRDCGHCDNCRARAQGFLPAETATSSLKPVLRGTASKRKHEQPPPPVPIHEPVPNAPELPPEPTPGFFVGQLVKHKAFGGGQVVETDGDTIVVRFPRGNKKVKSEYLELAA